MIPSQYKRPQQESSNNFRSVHINVDEYEPLQTSMH